MNGRRWKCNFCGFANETAHNYYAPLDDHGIRQDLDQRPELMYGVCEYLATADYLLRPPQPPIYGFLFDVTAKSVASGFLQEACIAAKESLMNLVTDPNVAEMNHRTEIVIMTFDRAIHYYNMNPELQSPQMVVISDLDDIFHPMPDDVLVNLVDNKDAIFGLLDAIPNLFSNTTVNDSCMCIAMQGAFYAMRHIGGKLLTFSCTTPNVGQVGKINANREAQAIRAGEKDTSGLLR